MKFRFYIADTFDGRIVGTDDEATALYHASAEECFVVDSETGEWLHIDGDRRQVEPATEPEE